MKKVVVIAGQPHQPLLRQPAAPARHPFEAAFHDLGPHTAIEALEALAVAVQAGKRDMNAYDWAEQALPGAALKVGYAVGTVEELNRTFARDQEFKRFITTVRSHEDAVRDTTAGRTRATNRGRFTRP